MEADVSTLAPVLAEPKTGWAALSAMGEAASVAMAAYDAP